jgi:uncharacterized membrane protein
MFSRAVHCVRGARPGGLCRCWDICLNPNLLGPNRIHLRLRAVTYERLGICIMISYAAVQPSQGTDAPGWFVPVLIVVSVLVLIFLIVVFMKRKR